MLGIAVFINGIVLCGLFVLTAILLLIDVFACNAVNVNIFLSPCLCYLFVGILLIILCKSRSPHSLMSGRDVLILVLTIWINVAISAALPFCNYDVCHVSFADACFESMSCITTTGSSVYDNIADLPITLQIWRLILHVIGGAGVVAIAIVALPIMRVGGMQLFRVENSGSLNGISVKTSSIAASFIGTYFVAIALTVILLHGFGLDLFASITYGIGAISTAGCNIHPYECNDSIKIILAIAMIIGGLNFFDIIRVFVFRKRFLVNNSQIATYITTIASAFIMITFVLLLYGQQYNFSNYIFDIASSITTSGSPQQIKHGNNVVHILLFLLMLVGGCSGSTSGGIKIFRIQILYCILKHFIKKISNQYLVSTPKYQRENIDYNLSSSIIVYFLFLIMAVIISVLLVCIFDDVDIVAVLLGVISSIWNSGQYIDIHNISSFAKFIFTVDMLIGRLDVVPVMLLFSKSIWTNKCYQSNAFANIKNE